MAGKRENAMGGATGSYKAEDLKNLRSLPDNAEFDVTFDERRKIMTRKRKEGIDDNGKEIAKTRARCSLQRAKLEEEELRLRLRIAGGR